MIILYLASQLSAPTPTPLHWIRNDDYPRQYIEAGRSFEIDIRATVRPDGTIQDCSVEKSSGDQAFDKFNCVLLIKRAKFKPATDVHGQPAFGVFRTRTKWMLDYGKEKRSPGDLKLSVAKLPDKLKSPTFVIVAVAVDTASQPSDCASAMQDQNMALVKVACAQLVRSYRALPARLPTGEVIPSIQTARVTFVSP